jgi:hypothetical protein
MAPPRKDRARALDRIAAFDLNGDRLPRRDPDAAGPLLA